MTKKLENAVARLRNLPDKQQDAIASLILEEVEGDAKWDQLFDESPDLLSRLADQAIKDEQAGLTRPLKPKSMRNPTTRLRSDVC